MMKKLFQLLVLLFSFQSYGQIDVSSWFASQVDRTNGRDTISIGFPVSWSDITFSNQIDSCQFTFNNTELSASEVDQILIDIADTGDIDGTLIFSGTNGVFTSAASSSISTLNSNGWTLSMPILEAFSPYFDHAWLADHALNTSAEPVSDGDLVETLVDDIKTTVDAELTYAGNSGQRTGFVQPVYYVYDGIGFVRFPNFGNVRYDEVVRSGIASPITLMLFMRPKKGASFESILKPSANGGFNVKDQNRSEFRFDRNTLTGARTQDVVAADFRFNRLHYIIVRYENGNESFLLNGAEIHDEGTVTDVDWAQMVYGTNTNVLAHDFIGVWVKHGALTPTEEGEIDAIMQANYAIDTDNPDFASTENLTVRWNSTSKYWFLSIDGSTEWTPPIGTTFRWVQAGSAGSVSFSAQTYITEALYSIGSPGDATTARLARADYDLLFPNNNGTDNIWVNCDVWLGGDVRLAVEGFFLRDNTP